jgi:hypothetical protein
MIPLKISSPFLYKKITKNILIVIDKYQDESGVYFNEIATVEATSQ